MSGKGSSPRTGVFDRPFPGGLTFFYDNRSPQEKYEDNWTAIFGKPLVHCGKENLGCSLYDQSIVDCDCDCEPCTKLR